MTTQSQDNQEVIAHPLSYPQDPLMHAKQDSPQLVSVAEPFQEPPPNGHYEGSVTTSEHFPVSGFITPPKEHYNLKITTPKFFLSQWFFNLPISSKQLVALLIFQTLTIIGISGVGAWSLISSGNKQLARQAESEIAVTDMSYMIKVNQMGLGFRGQSDNPAIIQAVKNYNQGSISPNAQKQVASILKNEVKARQIEYATLVGKDKRIIVNANANRIGEEFNPDNLVQNVLDNGKQLKVTTIIDSADLVRENSSLAQGIKTPEVLIRFVLTPVKDPATERVIGVLVAGDVVNGKMPIFDRVLTSLGSGYSGIYFRNREGNFILATSLFKSANQTSIYPQPNIPLPDIAPVIKAIDTEDTVIQRLKIDGEPYTVATKAIPNIYQQDGDRMIPISNTAPFAILVRGTSEAGLNSLLNDSLSRQFVIVAIALIATLGFAYLLGQAIVKPLQHLEKATRQFTKGDRQIRSKIYATDEVGYVAAAFNQLADNITTTEQQQTAEIKYKELLGDIAGARSPQELTIPLTQLLTDIREALAIDRLMIYRFLADDTGYLAAESVFPDFKSAFLQKLPFPPLTPSEIELYQQGQVTIDSENSQKEPEKLDFFRDLEIQSQLIVPITQRGELFGLLIAHDCAIPYEWENHEIQYLQQYANQIAQALTGIRLLETKTLEAQRQEQQNQAIQQELLELLSSIEGATSGDLTVRSEISAGQIGIVADFFNAIIENLADVVTQVKETTAQINTAMSHNAVSTEELAEKAGLEQEKIQQMLRLVEEMSASIQEVMFNAGSAAVAAQESSQTAQSGEEAMDRTVETILQLRSTVAETAKKVKRLGESSQQIAKVISLINEIALKTNLLAVNASIEAARAGEEGSGFAVVAEEVGQLAAQSATATKEIERIVASIQQGTLEVVKAMELGTSQVVEGTQKVENTRQSLQAIINESRYIDELVQSISQATLSQGQTSVKISQLMQDIANISQKTAKSSQEVSHSLQETVLMTEDLQTSMETFKVNEQ